MNVITLERKAVASLLKEVGIPSLPFLPERFVPPVAVITAGEPYINFESSTLCEGILQLQITLVAKTATNEVETDKLDTLLVKAINQMIVHNWAVTNVAQPKMLATGNANYLTVDISISTDITLGG